MVAPFAMHVLRTCIAIFLVVRFHATASPYNEDVPGPVEALLQVGTHRHLQALMENITVSPAMLAEFKVFANSTNSDASQAFLQARSSRTHVPSTQNADQARQVLNSMLLDTMGKLDLQRADCIREHEHQRQLLDETMQDVSSFNAQGTNARTQVMATQIALKQLQELLPRLNQELTLHETKCKDSIASLKQEVALVQDDAAQLASVSSSSTCTSLLQMGLMSCDVTRGHKTKSVVTFRHHVLRHKVAQLKSPFARKLLQRTLKQVFHHRPHRHSHPEVGLESLVEVGSRHHSRHHYSRHAHSNKHHRRHSIIESRHGGSRLSKRGSSRSCTISAAPDCNEIKDRLMLMQGNVADEIDGHLSDLAHTEERCKTLKSNLQEQIQSTSLRIQEQQHSLAEATVIMIQASEQSRLKAIQSDHFEAENKKLDSECKDSVTQAALQMCKIKTVRDELYGLASGFTTLQDKQMPVFIQDCEVSEWTPQECSKPCGGGVQNLVRVVVVPNEKGAACPPLTMQQSCNMHECPVDCEMEEWTGWTACSAHCGGGIKQRIRNVKRRAQHGGKLCGIESESQECGMDPCDRNCELSPWSGWSACAKACGGGFQMQTRHVTRSETGLGRCVAEDSPSRLQYQRCSNSSACKPSTGLVLKCASKVDVVFLLDVSGSIGSAGFSALKTAGASLVQAMDTAAGAQFAVLSYSGPKTMDKLKLCTGQGAAGTSVDLVADCNLAWVSHLSTDTGTVKTGINSLVWKKGSTMTSQALASAEAELVNGRSDTPAVVVAIADQLPMMPRTTASAAESLRRKARLVWVVAAESRDLPKFASMATKPVADNVIYMESMADISKPATLNKIISSVCSEVV